MGELRFCSHQAFKHAPLFCISFCVNWDFLVSSESNDDSRDADKMHLSFCRNVTVRRQNASSYSLLMVSQLKLMQYSFVWE